MAKLVLRIQGWLSAGGNVLKTSGRELAVAVGFLTVLPVPTIAFEPGLLGRAGRWFPLVGLLLSGLLLGGAWVVTLLFPPLPAAALLTALWVVLTGGLHLDGVADCCDGLLAPVSVERRLAIMRDPRSGAFAVIGVMLMLLLKWNAIAALLSSPAGGLPALVVAPIWSRWFLLWIARRRPARKQGLGAEFSQHLTQRALIVALALPILALGIFFHAQILLAVLLAFFVTLLIARGANARLGGVTGDIYGLTVELGELIILLVCAATLRS